MKTISSEIAIVKKHALWIRWAHWINFPILMLMILSGIQIYWANDIFTKGLFDRKLFDVFGLDHNLASGMYIHFALAWIFVTNGFFYTCFLLWSGEWRAIIPKISSFKQAILVLLYDFGIIKSLPPQGKFNAAQRIAYSGVIVLGVVVTASGFAIYKPIQLAWLVQLFFGYEGARLVHFFAMLGFLLFFVIHILQVARAGWNNFQSMVTGYEVVREPENKKNGLA